MKHLIAVTLLVISAGCGGGSPTEPSPAGATPPAAAGQPTTAASCTAITFVRIEGQTMTVGLNQTATVGVNRVHGDRLEVEDSVRRQASGDYRGDVHWDNDYVITATCANGATDTRTAHVGPEPVCGHCGDDRPTTPPSTPAPPSVPALPPATCDVGALDVALTITPPLKANDRYGYVTLTGSVRPGYSGSVAVYISTFAWDNGVWRKADSLSTALTTEARWWNLYSTRVQGKWADKSVDKYVAVTCGPLPETLSVRQANVLTWWEGR